jgi:hypothetical protein
LILLNYLLMSRFRSTGRKTSVVNPWTLPFSP